MFFARIPMLLSSLVLAAAAPATVLACCLPPACGLPCPAPLASGPRLMPPFEPSFHVEQGPTYQAVLIAEEDVERRLEFSHPHWFPYVAPRWRRHP